MQRLNVLIFEANKVKAECFRAATCLTDVARQEAERMQRRFLERFGEDYTQYATLTYEQWERSAGRGAA